MTLQQRRAIDHEFYRYEQNKKKAAEYVASHAFDNFSMDYSSLHVKSSQRNAPEWRLITEIGEAERAWKWCKVFENVMTKYRWEKKDELMRKKYIEKKALWRICDEIGIERRTYFYWLNDVLETALQWAKELCLM